MVSTTSASGFVASIEMPLGGKFLRLWCNAMIMARSPGVSASQSRVVVSTQRMPPGRMSLLKCGTWRRCARVFGLDPPK